MNDALANTPHPPYYAVIFSSIRNPADEAGYQKMAEEMTRLASAQPGYLGIETVRDVEGNGITVSYWKDEESIRNWYELSEHQSAQRQGRETWYRRYRVRVTRVERQYSFPSDA